MVISPGHDGLKNIVYNNQKRIHSLMFQSVTLPNGMIWHMNGIIERRRNDWNLYKESGLQEDLEDALLVGRRQLCIHGDRGYSRREFMEITFQRSYISAEQEDLYKYMSHWRITVEWMLK